MKNLNMSLTLSPDYKNSFVDIQKTETDFSFELENGKHLIKTIPTDIGRLNYFNNSILQAQFSFTYDFDEANRTLTLAGTDYSSKDALVLTTFPKGTNEYCHQSYALCKVDDEDSLYNPNWNYNTPMTPNLEDIFTSMLREANETLIETAKKIEGIIVRVRTHPPVLSPEEFSKMLFVYKKNELVGIHNPNQEYGEEFTIVSVSSVWGGTVRFNKGENFANVIGSTNDPQIGGLTWIELWRKQFGSAITCTSLDYNKFVCNVQFGLLGGHIIVGQQAQKVPNGSNSVYILPICSNHNNNDNIFMAALQYQDGIWLNNYLN